LLILDYQKSNCGAVQPTKECYNVGILQCWGPDAVKETIERRKISISAGSDMFNTLLNDLRKTGGFTENEIFSSVLEDEVRRRNLLSCLGINVNPNTSYAQLGELIIQYQQSNCGAVQPSTECYNLSILQCWGDQNVQRSLKIRGIAATGDIFQLLLDSLRQTLGFTQEEMLKLTDPMIQELLKCLQLNVPTDKKPIDVLMEYQLQNCQSGFNKPAIAVEPGLLPVSDLVKVLEARGVTISPTETRTTVESALVSSAKGNELSEAEVAVLSRESITNILDSKKIIHVPSEDKSLLIKKLFNR